jgi:DNA repair protein RecO (recombination protein O)
VPGLATLTPAIVVGSVRYGETSRIVRLATRDVGLQSAIAKGVSRPKSRFGALQLLSEGTAHLIEGRGDLATLVAFDASDLHAGLARTMTAFRAASALAEVAARAVPAATHPELYDALRLGVRLIEAAPEAASEIAGLAGLWRFVDALGHAPERSRCARDGRPLVAGGGGALSIDDGGLLCPTCASGGGASRLEGEDLAALGFLLDGTDDPPDLDARHARAHRRLLGRWVARHLTDGPSPAVEQWVRGDDSTPGRG